MILFLITLTAILLIALMATISEMRDLRSRVGFHDELFADLSKVHTVQSKSYQALAVKVINQEKSVNELYSSYFREHGEESEVIQ